MLSIRPKTDLRTLIALLAITSIVITLANTLYATWRVQRMVLIESTLEANRAYATKHYRSLFPAGSVAAALQRYAIGQSV